VKFTDPRVHAAAMRAASQFAHQRAADVRDAAVNRANPPESAMNAGIPIALGLFLALPAATTSAGDAHGAFAVGAQVVAPSDTGRLRALPLPQPGHLMQEDARGRPYFYAGDADSALAWYRERMRAAGYVLQAERNAGPLRELRWEREGEVVLVRLESALAPGATRISLAAVAGRR
jgi:hypothetical protein